MNNPEEEIVPPREPKPNPNDYENLTEYAKAYLSWAQIPDHDHWTRAVVTASIVKKNYWNKNSTTGNGG